MPIPQKGNNESNFSKMNDSEWWIGNGIGGWASGTVSGANTRKYHGLFVGAHPNAEKRWLLVSKLEEFAVIGGRRIPLSSNFYPNTVHPKGWKHIANFYFDGAVARWAFEVGGRRIAKEVWCERGKNIVYARYSLLQGQNTGIELFPFVNARNVHSIGLDANAKMGMSDEGGVNFKYPFMWGVNADRGAFVPRQEVYYNFLYPVERGREEKFKEDLACPGHFATLLQEGQHITLKIGEMGEERFFEPEYATEQMEGIVNQFKGHSGGILTGKLEALVRGSAQFVIGKEKEYGILAGYPYFGEWGRDTMIALPGICAYTGRHALARNIISKWIEYLKDGMLPNRFDENGNPAYESADGMLWMVWAITELEKERGVNDEDLKKWWPKIRKAMGEWVKGNRFVKIDKDGLAVLKKERLTWMDAQVNGKAVTPRKGKRVEINALWINALNNASRWAEKAGDGKSSEKFEDVLGNAKYSMEKFYAENLGYLYDGIEPEDGKMRPNQLWALAIEDVGIKEVQARNAMREISSKLWVSGKGIRTLAQGEPEYRGKYGGNMKERDLSYHQGAIWPWLSGAYAEAWLKIFPERMNEIWRGVEPMLNSKQGALLSLTEVYDPQALERRGCPAQAWSVGEVLRAGIMIERKRGQRNLGHIFGTTAYKPRKTDQSALK
ncbi:MAG: amylo-alpha-1,6-glucosidase [Candidatus Micrarchaeota archaeon]